MSDDRTADRHDAGDGPHDIIDADHPRPPERMPDEPGEQPGSDRGSDRPARDDATSVERYRDSPGASVSADDEPAVEPNEPG